MNVITDYEVIAKFCNLGKSKKEWIFDNRERLIMSANIYEKNFMKYLNKNKIEYIHQAPFIIDGNIYFLDFYIPKKKLAIEIDGSYHNSIFQLEKDISRDNAFSGIGIKTIRLLNEEIKDENQLNIRLSICDNISNIKNNKFNAKSAYITTFKKYFSGTDIYALKDGCSRIKTYKNPSQLCKIFKLKKEDCMLLVENIGCVVQIGCIKFSTNSSLLQNSINNK